MMGDELCGQGTIKVSDLILALESNRKFWCMSIKLVCSYSVLALQLPKKFILVSDLFTEKNNRFKE